MRQLLAIVLILPLLVGCAPTTFTYYKPVGPGGYFKSCGGGPDNSLGFKVTEGLGVMIHTGASSGEWGDPVGQLDNVSISFHLGAAHTLLLTSPNFELLTTTSKISISVSEVTRIDNIQKPDKKWIQKLEKFPILSELRGGLLPKGFRSVLFKDFQNWQAYRLTLPVSQRDAGDFAVRFPSALLDGKPIEIPDVRFEYGKYLHIRTLGC